MKNRKRILMLPSWYPHPDDPFDGDFIQRHAKAAALNYDVDVIFVHFSKQSSSSSSGAEYRGLKEQIVSLPFPFINQKLVRQLVWFRTVKKLISQYIEEKGKPDLVHVQVPWKAGLLALWLKHRHGIPYKITEHWGRYDASDKNSFHQAGTQTRSLLNRIYNGADGIAAVSHFLAEGLKPFVNKPVWEIPNVVDTSLFRPGEEKYSRFSFIHVSNMAAVKNVGSIMQAFRKLLENPAIDAQLIFVGNRDDQYSNLAGEWGMLNQSIFFRGEVSYQQTAEEMRRCHALVMFSNSETFSCVTAEALCSGLPVIASRAGALPEHIGASNGYLVNPGSVSELAETMEVLMKSYGSFDPSAIATEASSKFNYGTVAEKLAEFYEN